MSNETCPSCASTDYVSRGHAHGNTVAEVFQCRQCDLLFLPREIRPLADLDNHWYAEDIFQSDASPFFFQATMRTAYERQCDDLKRMLGSSGSNPPELLDIGCGIGVFLSIAKEKGFGITALESSENARRSLQNIGTAQASSFSELKDGSFDVVRLSHVLEHIPEPNGFLDECIRVLKPGGILVVIVPTGEPWMQRLVNLFRSRRSGNRKFTGGIYPYMHVLGFSTKSMARMMQSHHLDIVSLKSVSMGSGTYYPWFYDGLLSTINFRKHLSLRRLTTFVPPMLSFIGNPIGRGEWLAGHFRKPQATRR